MYKAAFHYDLRPYFLCLFQFAIYLLIKFLLSSIYIKYVL